MPNLVALFEKELDAFQILAQERVAELQSLGQSLQDNQRHMVLFEMQNQHDVKMALLHATYRNARTGPVPGVAEISEQVEILQDSPFFDADWYLAAYPDVAQASIDPAVHYASVGAFEGRNPSAAFDSMAYYMANRDVAKAGWPALVHYILFGKQAGRALA